LKLQERNNKWNNISREVEGDEIQSKGGGMSLSQKEGYFFYFSRKEGKNHRTKYVILGRKF
jgi:hypothetical protein